jgi:hypothetical protein
MVTVWFCSRERAYCEKVLWVRTVVFDGHSEQIFVWEAVVMTDTAEIGRGITPALDGLCHP